MPRAGRLRAAHELQQDAAFGRSALSPPRGLDLGDVGSIALK